MKQKKNRKKAGPQAEPCEGKPCRGRFARTCCRAAILATSYQIFSLGVGTVMDHPQLLVRREQGKTIIERVASGVSSSLDEPVYGWCLCAHLGQSGSGGGCGCTGCTGCMGCKGCTGGCTGYTSYNADVEFDNAFNAGRYAEAEEAARRAIQLQPDGPNYSRLGRVLYMEKRYAEAEETFKRSIGIDANYANSHHNYGLTLWMMGRLDEALREIETSIRLDGRQADYKKNLADLRQTIQNKQADELIQKGFDCFNRGQYAEAEAAYRKYLELRPNDSTGYNNLGLSIKNQKRYDEASKIYKKALKLNPNNADARDNLSWILLFINKDYDGGAALYREGIKLNPNEDRFHIGLGAALILKKDYVGAEKAARDYMKLNPKNPRAHAGLGNVLNMQGRTAEAETELRTALSIDPQHEGAKKTLVKVLANKAGDLYDKDKYSEAETAMREAVKLDPESEGARDELGIILAQQGKLAEAEAEYRTAAKLDPTWAEPFANLGLTLKREGKLIEAETAYRAAIKLEPGETNHANNLSDLLVEKGMGLREQGRLSEAEAAFREALTLNKSSMAASDFLASMTQTREQERKAREAPAEPAKPASSGPGPGALVGFAPPTTKPAPQEGSGASGTITVQVMSDGKYVPVVFVLPDLARTGPVQALPQGQSIKERGDKAQQASTVGRASEAARAGLTRFRVTRKAKAAALSRGRR